jgi:CheY-like chemotaxis protein
MFSRLGSLLSNASAGAPAKTPGDHATILIVDDSATMRAVVGKPLRGLGYKTLEADSGITGLGEWDSHKDEIALIISDIYMPGMDGMTFVKHVRKRTSKLPIALMSSRINDDSVWVAEEAGFRCLQKPFSDEQLFELVREMIGSPPSAPPPAQS